MKILNSLLILGLVLDTNILSPGLVVRSREREEYTTDYQMQL